MSIDAVYNGKILDYAGNIGRIGRLEDADGSAKAHSKLCGSTVIVDVKADGDTVIDYAHDVKACALGQASAAILAEHVVGSTLLELKTVRDQMQSMLKDNGPPPTGKFSELKFLEPVREYRARHASTMLAFNAVVDALQDAISKKDGLNSASKAVSA